MAPAPASASRTPAPSEPRNSGTFVQKLPRRRLLIAAFPKVPLPAVPRAPAAVAEETPEPAAPLDELVAVKG
ncbi:hypothetical protein [Streptomyces sp. NPDC001530]|uniref:hypothetical protein n=1 Tax=Streptomyces sp. NPDC001530 TaxID=3364582 RepID=UPI00368296FC